MANPVVDPDLIDECRSLGDEMCAARNSGGADGDVIDGWIKRFAHITVRLEAAGRPCPECGEPMIFDISLQAHVCHHVEAT